MSADEGRSNSSGAGFGSGYICDQGRMFLNAFGEAVQEVLRLHEQQFLAVVAGDTEASRFDLLIHEANDRKQNAKYAYLAHVESHGCSFQHETDKS